MNNFSYNQKEVLFKTICQYLKRTKARSLLDIGAGDDTLASRLAKIVPNYLAVEENRKFVNKLKKTGIVVKYGKFPIPIQGEFDVVLISHALPEKKKLYKNFLEKAWEKVKKGGILLIITLKGGNEEFIKLHKAIQHKYKENDRKLYDEMLRVLSDFGRVKIKKVVSIMRSQNIKVMVNILSDLMGIKIPRDKKFKDRLKRILGDRYKNSNGYYMPTPHVVLVVSKHA